MAWTYGFFNSVNGDRVYNAQQMSEIFKGLITDGVYASVGDKLAVQPSSGMTIQIGTGRGWFNSHWVDNATEYLTVLEAADVTLNRYAAVCIRVDDSDGGRKAEPYIKYSDYATTPIKPTMERSETINEYCLAYVYIGAGVSEITAANIEDTRGNNELCGWVTGLIEQLSTTTLFTQWEAIFTDWFNNLQDLINENTEAMLVAALPQSVTLTLAASNWTATDSGYTQAVSLAGMNTTKSIIVNASEETAEQYNVAGVKAEAQGENELTFTADTLPTVDVKVEVLHMGV